MAQENFHSLTFFHSYPEWPYTKEYLGQWLKAYKPINNILMGYLSFLSRHKADRNRGQTFWSVCVAVKSRCYRRAFTEDVISFSHTYIYLTK